MRHYPLFADLRDRPVLLAGAGKVAERKAESLLSAGARVRVVAETFESSVSAMGGRREIVWLGGLFEEAMLDEVYFVIAATDDGVFNRRVFEAAERRRNCAIRWIRRTCVRLSCLPWWIGGR